MVETLYTFLPSWLYKITLVSSFFCSDTRVPSEQVLPNFIRWKVEQYDHKNNRTNEGNYILPLLQFIPALSAYITLALLIAINYCNSLLSDVYRFNFWLLARQTLGKNRIFFSEYACNLSIRFMWCLFRVHCNQFILSDLSFLHPVYPSKS